MFISHFSSLRLLEVLIVQWLERSGWTLETFGEKAHFWIRFIGTGGLDLDTFFGRTQANSLEEGMATHSSILAWRIPQTEEPGGPQSVGSQSARHNRSDWVCMHTHTGQLTTEDDSLQIPGTNLDNKKNDPRELVYCDSVCNSVPSPWVELENFTHSSMKPLKSALWLWFLSVKGKVSLCSENRVFKLESEL